MFLSWRFVVLALAAAPMFVSVGYQVACSLHTAKYTRSIQSRLAKAPPGVVWRARDMSNHLRAACWPFQQHPLALIWSPIRNASSVIRQSQLHSPK